MFSVPWGNASRCVSRLHLILVRWKLLRKQKLLRIGVGWGYAHISDRGVNQDSHCGNSVEVPLRNQPSDELAIPLLDVYLKESESVYHREITHTCILWHYSKWLSYGISLYVCQQRNG